MSEAEITNVYRHEPPSSVRAKQLVILLHGLGSNGRDLISLAPLWAQALPECAFVSPDAPFPCDMVPPGYPESYQWFSLQDRDPDKMLQGVRIAAPILERFIAEQIEAYNVPPEKCVLAGFSQGTMMSLYEGPRYPQALGGILGYSGALIGGEALGGEGICKVPVHLIHGEADDVVPVEAYHMARAALEGAEFKVSGHTTPGLAHGIDQEGIESGAAFLKAVLG
ncbi:MAG: phospholipase [Alphaproteobacteria bacterium]|nr:phospholipase [Alphaproteobacteria bacterium]